MKIFKDFRFEAAHYLPNVPEDHQCRRMHGHSYRLRVVINGRLGKESGWVMDFAELKSIVGPLIDSLDHRCLNDIPGLENPTAEQLAIWIWDKTKPQLSALAEIQLNETESSGVIYNGSM
jgi:6-pyruvoyltetrahydropterin/6-carboxytetrahydropterin synthase